VLSRSVKLGKYDYIGVVLSNKKSLYKLLDKYKYLFVFPNPMRDGLEAVFDVMKLVDTGSSLGLNDMYLLCVARTMDGPDSIDLNRLPHVIGSTVNVQMVSKYLMECLHTPDDARLDPAGVQGYFDKLAEAYLIEEDPTMDLIDRFEIESDGDGIPYCVTSRTGSKNDIMAGLDRFRSRGVPAALFTVFRQQHPRYDGERIEA